MYPPFFYTHSPQDHFFWYHSRVVHIFIDEGVMASESAFQKYGLNPQGLPRHIAIIMDGNGRWAKSHLRPRLFGHKEGAESVRNIVTTCREMGVEALTLYAFSSENWNRPQAEVSGLMTILQKFLSSELSKMQKNGIRLHCIGDIESLPQTVQTPLHEAMESTRHNTELTLTLALSYGGRNEICRAIKSIASSVEAGDITLDDINDELISSSLDTAILPEPDLLIRTGGEARLSNFLLWQLSYAELYFTDIMWPDFRAEQLAQAIAYFQDRERRFGKTGEQIQQTKEAG